jgi:uncharacterized protein (TIGR03083 family)
MTFPSTPPDPLQALAEECELVSSTVRVLSEEDFARSTRLPAWNVKGLLGHMYRDVDRLNTGLGQPAPPAADTDAVTYWRTYSPAADGPAIADRALEVAAAHATGRDLAEAWDEMWRRALAAAREAGPDRLILTWGPILRMDEFLKTRVLEITVHRMDLEHALGRKGWGTDQAVSIVDDILVGLLGQEPPAELEWDVVDFIERGTGRRRLTSEEVSILGPLAEGFPLLA